ncbi:hypothetical protein ACTFIV_004389 [Dictyostelium citrinum]
MNILYTLNDCLFEHSYEVTTLATNGKRYLISGSKDCTIKVWIVERDRPTTLYRTLIGHSSIIQDVAITQDDRYVISGSWDSNVCIWDIESGECIKTIKHTSQIMKVSYINQLENGDYISSITSDGTVMIWKLFLEKKQKEQEGNVNEKEESKEEQPKFYKSNHEKGSFNTGCAFSTSPDINPILCTSGSDGKIYSCFNEFRNYENKLSTNNIKNNNNNINNNNKNNDNDNNKCIETIINNDANKIIKHWKHDSDGIINYILFSPSNYFISSGCSEGIVCLWGYNDIGNIIKLNCNSAVNCLSFNPIRYQCSTATDDYLLIWDLETKKILTTIVIDDFSDQPIYNENKDELILKYKGLERDKESYKTQLNDQKYRDKPLIRSLSTCWFSDEIIFVACNDNTIREYKINHYL